MGMYGGGSDGSEYARKQEQEGKARIDEGKAAIDKTFAGFDDKFYAERAQDYENFAVPQMADQLHTTRNQLAAGLARRGLMKSAAGIRGHESLDKFAQQKTQEIADAGINESNKLRAQVEDNRNMLINQLIASGDPSVASTGALAAAKSIDTSPSFKPLGNMFNDWTEIWSANQNARTYNPSVPPVFSFGSPNNRASSYTVGG